MKNYLMVLVVLHGLVLWGGCRYGEGISNCPKPKYSFWETVKKVVNRNGGETTIDSDFSKEIEATRFKDVEKTVNRSLKRDGNETVNEMTENVASYSFGIQGETIQPSTSKGLYTGDKLSPEQKVELKNFEVLKAFESRFDPKLWNRTEGPQSVSFAVGRGGVILTDGKHVKDLFSGGLNPEYRYETRDDIAAFVKTQNPLAGNGDWSSVERSERTKPWPTNKDIKYLIRNSIILETLYKRKGFNNGIVDVPLFIVTWDGTSKGNTVIKVTVHSDSGAIEVNQIDHKGRETEYAKPIHLHVGSGDDDFFNPENARCFIDTAKTEIEKLLQTDKEFAELLPQKNMYQDVGNHAGKVIENGKGDAQRRIKSKQVCLDDNLGDVEIDTSKLVTLQKECIQYLESIVARGEKTPDEEERLKGYLTALANEGYGMGLRIETMYPNKDEQNQCMRKVMARTKPNGDRIAELVQKVKKMGMLEKVKDNPCCTCNDPDPNITIPATGAGWAKCRECGKLIGTVMVRNGNVSVISKNPAAKDKVERMIKEAKSAKGK